jgi:cysteine synthase
VANPVFKSIIHNILENPFDLNHKTPAENRSIKDIRAISGPRSARPGKVFEKVAIVTDEEALHTSRRLIAEEGILCGISSGTNVAAALRLAKELGEGKTVVTVLPDTGERYFSTELFS